jgi:hypothetical protein
MSLCTVVPPLVPSKIVSRIASGVIALPLPNGVTSVAVPAGL